MAIGDLEALEQELPEVFEARMPPIDLNGESIIIPIDDPESPAASPLETASVDESYDSIGKPRSENMFPDGINPAQSKVTTEAPVRRDTFPGSPTPWQKTMSQYPPPDALAFYLPFHYFFPDLWGIYLTVEGVFNLAHSLRNLTKEAVTLEEGRVIARMFLYGHEAYHHAVECFATRLEVTHRTPLYRLGFEALYRKQIGTDDALEEALANAKAHGLVRRVAARLFKSQEAIQRDVHAAIIAYIKGCPPGYRRGVEVARRLKEHERTFAEDNHRVALSSHPQKRPDLWTMFPYAIAGIARRVSRVNYVIHRSSPLFQRLPADLRYLPYRDSVRKLKALAKLEFVRQGGRGSHEIWRTPLGKQVVIPKHHGDFPPGTLAKIIKQAGLGMSIEEFVRAEPI